MIQTGTNNNTSSIEMQIGKIYCILKTLILKYLKLNGKTVVTKFKVSNKPNPKGYQNILLKSYAYQNLETIR